MSNILVVSGHSNLEASRVNSAILRALEGMDVTIHKLCELYPTYNFDVVAEQRLLTRHERIVLIFPMYWYSCPAILKKWIDDVFLPGFAYARGGDKLVGKEFLVVTTVGAPEGGYRAGGFNNFTVDELFRPFQQTVAYVRGKYLPPLAVYDSVFMDDEEIAAASVRVAHAVTDAYDPPEVIYEKLLLKAEAAQIALIQ